MGTCCRRASRGGGSHYAPGVIRIVATVSLLLVAGCAPTEPAAPAAASPTEPSDRFAAGACLSVARAIEENDLSFSAATGPASRAVLSTDPGIQQAGRRLAVVGKEAGDLFVEDDPKVDPGPTNARVAEAQRQLLSACTDLFGPQPWKFDR